MDDLISRKATIVAIYKYFGRIGMLKKKGLSNKEKAIRLDAIGVIKSMPPAQPELVWCKDCIHCEYALDDTRFCAKLDGIRVWADDFCSRGERRE